jgi:hypothetical protein
MLLSYQWICDLYIFSDVNPYSLIIKKYTCNVTTFLSQIWLRTKNNNFEKSYLQHILKGKVIHFEAKSICIKLKYKHQLLCIKCSKIVHKRYLFPLVLISSKLQPNQIIGLPILKIMTLMQKDSMLGTLQGHWIKVKMTYVQTGPSY